MSIGDFKKSNKPVTSSGGGYKPLDDLGQLITNPEPIEETIEQRAGKQKAARREELTYTEEDEKRWAKCSHLVHNLKNSYSLVFSHQKPPKSIRILLNDIISI